MRILINYSIIIFLLGMSVACRKENRLMYQEDPGIYFIKNLSVQDSTIYSFGVRPPAIITDTVYLTLRIMGTARAYDRSINIIMEPGSTAVQGYHFNFGPLVMPAGQYETKIPVYLYRKRGMKDSVIVAKFGVGESADFKPGYYDVVNSSVYSRLHYKIAIDDQILKPSNWEGSLRLYFGDFSIVKFQFMMEATGKLVWTGVLYPGERDFLISTINLALYEYRKAHGPLIDEKGVEVVFP